MDAANAETLSIDGALPINAAIIAAPRHANPIAHGAAKTEGGFNAKIMMLFLLLFVCNHGFQHL